MGVCVKEARRAPVQGSVVFFFMSPLTRAVPRRDADKDGYLVCVRGGRPAAPRVVVVIPRQVRVRSIVINVIVARWLSCGVDNGGITNVENVVVVVELDSSGETPRMTLRTTRSGGGSDGGGGTAGFLRRLSSERAHAPGLGAKVGGGGDGTVVVKRAKDKVKDRGGGGLLSGPLSLQASRTPAPARLRGDARVAVRGRGRLLHDGRLLGARRRRGRVAAGARVRPAVERLHRPSALGLYARRAKVAKVGDVVVAPGVGLECAC
jgi:hypothetical protein